MAGGEPMKQHPNTAARGKRAYMMRQRTGCTWTVIGRALDYSRIGAWITARRWAEENGEPWPPAPYLSTGRICYQMASVDQMTWEDIAEELGKTRRQVWTDAYCFARYNNLPWPKLGKFPRCIQDA